MARLEAFLWLAGLLAMIGFSWLATGSEPYPTAFGPASGFWARAVSGDRGAWLLVAPALTLSAVWAFRRWDPSLVLLVGGMLAMLFPVLFAYWPELPRFLAGLANVLLAVLLFLLLLPVALVKSLFGV